MSTLLIHGVPAVAFEMAGSKALCRAEFGELRSQERD
jgi:hypothetical protein